MYDPTFVSRVTMAIHEDQVRALGRTRLDHVPMSISLVRRSFGLYRGAIHRRNTPYGVEHRDWSVS